MTDNLPAPAQDDRGGLPAGLRDLLEDVKARIRVASDPRNLGCQC